MGSLTRFLHRPDDIWSMVERGKSDQSIGYWEDCFLIIACRCRPVNDDDPAGLLNHEFLYANSRPITYRFKRSGKVKEGEYIEDPSRKVLTIEARSQSLTKGFLEAREPGGRFGQVKPDWSGSVRVEVAFEDVSEYQDVREPLERFIVACQFDSPESLRG